MKASRLDAERIEELRLGAGCEEIEVFLKQGRSRRLVRAAGIEHASESVEQGWAVRAATQRGSFFRSGTGEPQPGTAWPVADGFPLRFPEPGDRPSWSPPAGMNSPLATDSEIRLLVVALEKELARTLPSARLDHLVVEEGQSESVIGNSRGILESWRGRAAVVTLEASAAPDRSARVRLEVAERELREISPRRLGRRLVDLLTVRHDGRPVVRDRSEVVVSPRVACSLLIGLAPLFDSGRSSDLLAALGSPRRLAGEALYVIDDGRLPGGILSAPVDGEGTPTRETVLIEGGVFSSATVGLVGTAVARQGRGLQPSLQLAGRAAGRSDASLCQTRRERCCRRSGRIAFARLLSSRQRPPGSV